MAEPYYQGDMAQLYLGDMREVLPALDVTADAVCTDPPYGSTVLPWDTWPTGWTLDVADTTNSMWMFGSMTMFLARVQEIIGAGWRMSQDLVWEKHNGSGFATDRFRRVHELAVHWYLGPWREVYHEVPRILHDGDDNRRRSKRKGRSGQAPHMGAIGPGGYSATDRMARSVIRAKSCNGTAIHPTQKPAAILASLIQYAVPPGGLVLDPFAGSCSTLLTARQLGRRAIGIEANEAYCEKAAERLSITDLFTGEAS